MKWDELQNWFKNLLWENDLLLEKVMIKARVLSSGEAIGSPYRDDFPLLIGKEKMMEANFKGSKGQAFTDLYGDYSGTLQDVVDLELKDNFARAVFISALNAVMRHLDMVTATQHCRNEDLKKCAEKLVGFTKEQVPDCRKVALVGLQPAFAEHLAREFELHIFDLDKDNWGKDFSGAKVRSGAEFTQAEADWADIILATGSTAVNDTIHSVIAKAPDKVYFYGVTIAGAAKVWGLNSWCAFAG